uniref:Uncharacterized protein n=1 Tax=candidate division WOR-3 bacterium TaxID=2052148 RepID=A0A7V5XZG1_UNCW3
MGEVYLLKFPETNLKKAKEFLDNKKGLSYYPLTAKNLSVLTLLEKFPIYFFENNDFLLVEKEEVKEKLKEGDFLLVFFEKKEKNLKRIFKKLKAKEIFLNYLLALKELPPLPKIVEKEVLKEKRAEEFIKALAQFSQYEKEKGRLWKKIKSRLEKEYSLKRADVIILLLTILGKVLGITRLMKYLFLLKKESSFTQYVKNYYRFAPYSLGPFDKKVYWDLENLIKKGLVKKRLVPKLKVLAIEKEIISYFNGETIYEYSLTEKGLKKGKELLTMVNNIDKKLIKEILKLKSSYQRYRLLRLIKEIYLKYPEYQKKSKIWEKIKENE